jgi:hypothetical protein
MCDECEWSDIAAQPFFAVALAVALAVVVVKSRSTWMFSLFS